MSLTNSNPIESDLFVEYLRTGMMRPLTWKDRKEDVERKLGAPDDWKGRTESIGWYDPLLSGFRDSYAWHYGGLCVVFMGDEISSLSISCDDYKTHPRKFKLQSPFSELPLTCSVKQVINRLRLHRIEFNDFRDQRHGVPEVVNEAGVAVGCANGEPDTSAILFCSGGRAFDDKL